MKWDSFPLDVLLYGSDEEVGKALRDTWIKFQAEKCGIDDPANPPPEFSEQVVRLSQEMDTDDVAHIPLVKAQIIACAGDYARAGKIARDLMRTGAIQIQNGRLANVAREYKARQRRAAVRATEGSSRAAQEARNLWRKLGAPLRAKHPTWSDSRLATEIGRRPGVKAKTHTIRMALPSLGLSSKPKKVDQ